MTKAKNCKIVSKGLKTGKWTKKWREEVINNMREEKKIEQLRLFDIA